MQNSSLKTFLALIPLDWPIPAHTGARFASAIARTIPAQRILVLKKHLNAVLAALADLHLERMIARTASSNGDYTVVQYVCARSRKYGSSCTAAVVGGCRGAAAGSSASVTRCAVGDGGARAIDDSDDESAPGTSRSGSDDDSES